MENMRKGLAGQRYKSGHFEEQTNPLLHIRTQDMRDAQNQKWLLIDELQSDWANDLRKQYQKRLPKEQTWVGKAKKILEEKGILTDNWSTIDNDDDITEIPQAPLLSRYHELGFKAAIQQAVKEGDYAGVAWTTGKQQQQRYNQAFLGNISRLEYRLQNDNTGGSLNIIKQTGPSARTERNMYISIEDLPNFVGPELAERLLQNLPSSAVAHKQGLEFLKELDQRVPHLKLALDPQNSTKYLKNLAQSFRYSYPELVVKIEDFLDITSLTPKAALNIDQNLLSTLPQKYTLEYDQKLPSIANKLGQRFGTKHQPVELITNHEEPIYNANSLIRSDTFHALPITPQMSPNPKELSPGIFREKLFNLGAGGFLANQAYQSLQEQRGSR